MAQSKVGPKVRTDTTADCWLLYMIHASYILNHLSCEALDGNVPLGMFYGVSPDISTILLYTFYQPVFCATHNQSYPSAGEGRAVHWVGFGEHVADSITHEFLDDETKKILYRSAVIPSDSAHPNKRLVLDGVEISKTFTKTTNKHYNWMNKMATASGMMPPHLRWTKSMNVRSFKTMKKLRMIPNQGRYQMLQMNTRKSEFTSYLLSNMMADARLGWLLEDISLQILLKASTLELSPSDPLDWLYF